MKQRLGAAILMKPPRFAPEKGKTCSVEVIIGQLFMCFLSPLGLRDLCCKLQGGDFGVFSAPSPPLLRLCLREGMLGREEADHGALTIGEKTLLLL